MIWSRAITNDIKACELSNLPFVKWSLDGDLNIEKGLLGRRVGFCFPKWTIHFS